VSSSEDLAVQYPHPVWKYSPPDGRRDWSLGASLSLNWGKRWPDPPLRLIKYLNPAEVQLPKREALTQRCRRHRPIPQRRKRKTIGATEGQQ